MKSLFFRSLLLLFTFTTLFETNAIAQDHCRGCFNYACDALACDLTFTTCDSIYSGINIQEAPGGVCDTIYFTNIDSVPDSDVFITTTINIYQGDGYYADIVHTVEIADLSGTIAVSDGDGGLNFADDFVIEYVITTLNCHGKRCAFELNNTCEPPIAGFVYEETDPALCGYCDPPIAGFTYAATETCGTAEPIKGRTSGFKIIRN